MKRPINRRALLLAAGVATAARAAAAQSTDVRGAVGFESGAPVPEGRIELYLTDPAIQDDAQLRAAKTLVTSSGKSKTIAFALSLPAGATASPTLQVVARLERMDGWLIARGSARYEAGSPVHITLNTAVY